jgi:raffinose/stachyose/melibiose transport system substrate-binding protein
MLIRYTAGLAAAAMMFCGAASAQTTVKWLHIEQNPAQVKIWEEAARSFEAKNPGVKVEMQFLENEAYKAKLPTILQSRDRPHVIYSWGGGVMKTQIEAGVIEDITAQVKGFTDNLSPSAVAAFTENGKIYGVPMVLSQVGFMYNRDLFAKANVDGDKIKTWDDLLGAVKTLKAAGITPIAVGGGDKWPLHFYWTHLAVRVGGKGDFDAAMRGEKGGFNGETFLKSGELMKQLVDLQPFQNGFLGFKNQQALGFWADGKAAMTLAISTAYRQQAALAADKKGIVGPQLGWFAFPTVPGGKGEPSDTLGGINGWLVTKGAPKESVDFLKHFVSMETQQTLAKGGYLIPVVKGADAAMDDPFLKRIAQNIASSKYHQIFYDQMLGPNVGRVVNDTTAELAGGSMTPPQVAKAIQDAYKQGN